MNSTAKVIYLLFLEKAGLISRYLKENKIR